MQKPPPRPVQEGDVYQRNTAPVDRRKVFANRGRTNSSGSTRGAFGMNDPGDSGMNGPTVPQVVFSGAKKRKNHDEEQGMSRNISNLKSGYGTNQQTVRDVSQLQTSSPERDFYARIDKKKLEADLNASLASKTLAKEMSYNSFPAVEPPIKRKGPRTEINTEWSESEASQYSAPEEKFAFWKSYFYDHENPEFTSRQQTSWAVILGAIMGLFTAVWSQFIEWCIEITWVKIPEFLLELGVFTDLDGYFPLPHYMWICPAIYGGIMSYITAMYSEKKSPVPGQNEWIETLHSVGIMDHSMYFPMVFLSTAGMASGLSLGPEMPLVVTGGMVGSLLGSITRQSVLSARVMNLTASAAGIGGFFGFPMAGALFVLELPHRMGLQYFEALSPAVVASIVSVIVNRMYTKDEVTGYFEYPFITSTLPSHIFYIALVYGVVGCIYGVMYAEGVLWCKHWVHEWFHVPHDDHAHEEDEDENTHNHGEIVPLVEKSEPIVKKKKRSLRGCIGNFFGIAYEPYRAAVAGALVGVITGVICMFLPINLFWGEAQLQTLIDKGKTPLPIFGYGNEPTADLIAYGYCMVDQDDEAARVAGFSMSCAGIIALTKIFVVGISLGTGVCGGHFWAPLFVGCAGAQFFNDLMLLTAKDYGFGAVIGEYPCAAIICIMGASHVVTFRAHIAIMLILTLTISSFSSDINSEGSGDFSAIFPLLVMACFVPMSLKFTRDCKFYAKQRCRGDITAIPEVLCEPYKAGMPGAGRTDFYDDYSGSSSYGSSRDMTESHGSDTGISMEGDSIKTESRHGIKSILGKEVEEATVQAGKNASATKSSPPEMRSDGSVRSSSSRRSSSKKSVERPLLTRTNSRGQVVDFQPTLLNQGREHSTRSRSNSRSSTPVNMPIPPSSTKSHRRTKSGTSLRNALLPTADALGMTPPESDLKSQS